MASVYGKSDWIFEIRDQDGNNRVRLTAANKRKVAHALGSGGQASFTINLNDVNASEFNLRESRSQLYVYRKGTLYFSGKIMVVERGFDESTQEANVIALGWMWFFEKRIIAKLADVTYTAVDAGSIAWTLVNTSQQETNGDLGITQGTIQTSQNLTITYTRQKLRPALDDLTSQAGIEIEVTPNKIFNVYYPKKGTDRSASVIFKYPGNLKSARPLSDATTMVNDILALGRGMGAEEITANVEDTGVKEIYGLFQELLSHKEIDNSTILTSMANYYLNLRKSPRLTLDVTAHGNDEKVDLSQYVVGDTVKIEITHDNYTLAQNFRIFEIHVDIGDDDKETVRLVTALV